MKIQASSVHRISRCPGSALLAETLDKDLIYSPFKDAASFGRDIHDIAEQQLKGAPGTIPAMLKKAGYEKDTNDYDRGLNAVKVYKAHFNKILKKYEIKTGTKKAIIEGKFRVEVNGFDLVFKCDAMLVCNQKDIAYIDIFDLKTGNFDYTNSASEQLIFSLMVYILGQYKKVKSEYICRVHIVQPNYYSEPEKIITMDVEITPAVVSHYFEELAYTFVDDKTFNAGDHCTFCPAILVCPKMQISMKYLSRVAQEFNDDLPTVTDENLETFFLLKKNIESYLKAVEGVVEKRMLSGSNFKNVYHKMVSGKRFWKDEKTVANKLKHLGAKRFEPPKLLSPAKMESLAGRENMVDLFEQLRYKKLAIRDNPFTKVGKND